MDADWGPKIGVIVVETLGSDGYLDPRRFYKPQLNLKYQMGVHNSILDVSGIICPI